MSIETNVLEVKIKSDFNKSAPVSRDISMSSAPFKTDISAFSPQPIYTHSGEPSMNTLETKDTSYSREMEFTDLLNGFANNDSNK